MQLKKFIGKGYEGSVFLYELQNQLVAVKFRTTFKNYIQNAVNIATNEFNLYQGLKDFSIIPTPIEFQPEKVETYESLNLVNLGKLSSFIDEFYLQNDPIFFVAPIFIQYIKKDWEYFPRDDFATGKKPKLFFDKLDQGIEQIFRKGVLLPRDVTVLGINNSPYLCDLSNAINKNDSKREQEFKNHLNKLRRLYQI